LDREKQRKQEMADRLARERTQAAALEADRREQRRAFSFFESTVPPDLGV
jgi:hypothetical protein